MRFFTADELVRTGVMAVGVLAQIRAVDRNDTILISSGTSTWQDHAAQCHQRLSAV